MATNVALDPINLLGVGKLAGTGLKQGVKAVGTKSIDNLDYLKSRANYQGDHLTLTKTRLNNEGYDRLLNNEMKISDLDKTSKYYYNPSEPLPEPNTFLLDPTPNENTLFKYRYLRSNLGKKYNNFNSETRKALNSIEPIKMDAKKIQEKFDIEDSPAFAFKTKLTFVVDNEGLKKYGWVNPNKEVESHEFSHLVSSPTSKPEGFGNIPRYVFNGTPVKKLYGHFDYLKGESGEELSARGTQLKNYFGIKDKGDMFTPDMLKYAEKNYIKDVGLNNNMDEFFSLISDYKKAAK